MWKKELESKHLQSFDLLGLVIVVLVIIGGIIQNPYPYIAAGLLFIHLLLLKQFEYAVTEKLSLKNPRRSIRLFPGEQSIWNIEMKNDSVFPIVNGKLKFNLGFNVRVKYADKESYWQGIEIPFSLSARKKMETKVPITAMKRGTARINQLQYMFPHLFSFQPMMIYFKNHYQTEFIVYPELKEVAGLEAVFHLHPGETRMQFSPYEDIQSPIGTRDYQSGDSFQRINWKASVRSQELQTNVFEKVADRSFVFLANLKQELKAGQSERMENLLSYTAYLSKYATEQEVSYEIRLNAVQQSKSGRSLLQQTEGKDSAHLAKSLELLARIPRQPITDPFELLLYDTAKKLQQRKTILLIGEITQDSLDPIMRLERKGHVVFQLKEADGSAFIIPFEKERIA